MRPYLDLLQAVLDTGTPTDDRTGVGTRKVFAPSALRFDLVRGFPLVTTKHVPFRLVAEELFWMLRGETNVRSLQEKNVHIWDAWADKHGDLGPVYGASWRRWKDAGGDTCTPCYGETSIDQLAQVVEQIKRHPSSRRHVVSAWNVAALDQMALPPCHVLFQFDVTGGRLNCQMYQRSADLFLGVPFNIASYALLTHLVAHHCGLLPGVYTHVLGDAHIYTNHVEQVQLQLTRQPLPLSCLRILAPPERLPWDYVWADLRLEGYRHHNILKAKGAI